MSNDHKPAAHPELRDLDVSREAAKLITTALFEATTTLENSLSDVNDTEPVEVMEAYRRLVSKVMAAFYFDALGPLCARYPELAPPGFPTAKGQV